jgi:hypothetical protein
MDDLIFTTVGKLYFEVMRLQQMIENQQKLIADLENKLQSPLSSNPK